MPAYGALNSSFTVNGAVHDPLTGLDTDSGNDRITTGLGEDWFTTGTGGDSFNCDDILLGHGAIGYEMQAGMGISANARGNTTGTIAALQIDTGSGNDPIVYYVGTTSGPGGTTFFSGYSEAVGLDGYMVCPEPPFLMNIGGSAGPGGTSFFTNFAMPVGDFI